MSTRKHTHEPFFKVTSKQVELAERQYWARYNNEMLEASLYYKHNTNEAG
jgi:hypothetical protein